MTDIALISPPSRSFNHYRPPMALLYLAGHLQKHHLKVKIIDITIKEVIRSKNFTNELPKKLIAIEKTIISSPKKYNYFFQSINLFREILNQKLS